jgi:3-oxoadipate enol-lactonase
MPHVGAGDIEIRYEIVGNGPRLLYIGGTGGDLRRPPNAPSSPLRKRFELLAHDQRGLGRTDKPDGPYMEFLAG